MRDVLQVTWDWQSQLSHTSEKAGQENRKLRTAAVIQASVMAAVGAVLFFGFGHLVFAKVVWGLALLFLLLGLVAPPAYRPVHRFGQWLGGGFGHLLRYLLLVPLFYLFFTPVGLLLRLQRRDPMHRKPRSTDLTYWIPRRPKGLQENVNDQFIKENKEGRTICRPVGSVGFPEADHTS